MDKLKGKKTDRRALFGAGTGDQRDIDVQDVEAYESMMKARLGAQENGESRRNPAEGAVASANSDDNAGADPASDAPMFQMFAGAGPVKVTTASADQVFVAPKRPEVPLEESDSEEHWNSLLSVAVDAQTIKAHSAIPTPDLQYLKRVIHIKLEPATGAKCSPADSTKADRQRLQQRRRRLRLRGAKAADGASAMPEPYVRVLSPYSGGVLRGEMLADVVRREEARAKRDASRAAAKRGRGGGGLRGRGRGRGSAAAAGSRV
ncbi:hypothetical protein LPJ61_000075 [Coemansia biformis]|uniref:Uncharacterized protein n=1 Tax=Coemansia biformis TaxID=1286918 RepID=A0A9W8CZE1_9FUNG|nr:hypothetical protein LPJ61_000075 [Coemansia biformis]